MLVTTELMVMLMDAGLSADAKRDVAILYGL